MKLLLLLGLATACLATVEVTIKSAAVAFFDGTSTYDFGTAEFDQRRPMQEGDVFFYILNLTEYPANLGTPSTPVDIEVTFGTRPQAVPTSVDWITLQFELSTFADAFTCFLELDGCNPRTFTTIYTNLFLDDQTTVVGLSLIYNQPLDLSVDNYVITMYVQSFDGPFEIQTPPVLAVTFQHPDAPIVHATESDNIFIDLAIVYLDGATSWTFWGGTLFPQEDTSALLFVATQPIGPGNELFTINIYINHDITSGYAYGQLYAVRLSVLVEGDLTTCAFPLLSPSCQCTTMATVEFRPDEFVISAPFMCNKNLDLSNNILLSMYNLAPYGSVGDLAGIFPPIQSTSFEAISMSITKTTFAVPATPTATQTPTPTTTPTTTMISTPTDSESAATIGPVEMAELGGEKARTSLLVGISVSAACASLLVAVLFIWWFFR